MTTNHTPIAHASPGGPEPLIRPETSDDHQAVPELHLAAFADDKSVAALVDVLREASAPLAPMSFVATIGHHVVGHVLLSASRLDAPRRLVDVLVLAPLGVLPAFQNRGIGTRLIEHALSAADGQGTPLLFVEGAPGYYGSRGFERADQVGFRPPSLRIPAAAFQVARLSAYEPWMTGTLSTPSLSGLWTALVCAARSFRPQSRHTAGRQPERIRCDRASWQAVLRRGRGRASPSP